MFSPRKSFLVSTPVSVSVDLCRTVALSYFLIASFSVMINLRCLSNFLSRFWKYLHAKIAFGFLTLFRWLCNLKLDAFSIFPIYCFVAQREAKGLIAFLQTWTKLVETKLENPVNSRNDSIFQIPISPLCPPISMLNLAKFCFQKPKTLPTTLILGERGFFTEKQIFYFVSTVLSKIVGYWYFLKKKCVVLNCMLVYCML